MSKPESYASAMQRETVAAQPGIDWRKIVAPSVAPVLNQVRLRLAESRVIAARYAGVMQKSKIADGPVDVNGSATLGSRCAVNLPDEIVVMEWFAIAVVRIARHVRITDFGFSA